MQENSWLLLHKWMYTFICMTASFGFGDSSWPYGWFSCLLSMWEKISPFLTVFSGFSPIFLPSPSHSFLSEKNFLSFSLCEKFFLMWIESYIQTLHMCFTPSPYVRKFFSISHSFLSFSLCEIFSCLLPTRENFSCLLIRWENFSHIEK